MFNPFSKIYEKLSALNTRVSDVEETARYARDLHREISQQVSGLKERKTFDNYIDEREQKAAVEKVRVLFALLGIKTEYDDGFKYRLGDKVCYPKGQEFQVVTEKKARK